MFNIKLLAIYTYPYMCNKWKRIQTNVHMITLSEYHFQYNIKCDLYIRECFSLYTYICYIYRKYMCIIEKKNDITQSQFSRNLFMYSIHVRISI